MTREDAVNADNSAPGHSAGPTAPDLTSKDLLKQFWADAYGKEVQTAATYSYTWLADQFGHICIGIIVNFAATLVTGVVNHARTASRSMVAFVEVSNEAPRRASSAGTEAFT